MKEYHFFEEQSRAHGRPEEKTLHVKKEKKRKQIASFDDSRTTIVISAIDSPMSPLEVKECGNIDVSRQRYTKNVLKNICKMF